jgi:hypothetical protein
VWSLRWWARSARGCIRGMGGDGMGSRGVVFVAMFWAVKLVSRRLIPPSKLASSPNVAST